VTMQQLVRRTLRMNPSRVIVGEVLGPEVVTMLNAMSQGNDGSLSTIHARSPRETFTRIATYAKQADERVDPETAHMLVAGALDLVVFVRLAPDTQLSRVGEPPRVRRYVSDVLEVNGYDGAVLASAVFAPGPDGRAAVNPDATLASATELAVFGYRHDSYGRDHLDQAWGA
jgi:pilus assembly protein CpaF